MPPESDVFRIWVVDTATGEPREPEVSCRAIDQSVTPVQFSLKPGVDACTLSTFCVIPLIQLGPLDSTGDTLPLFANTFSMALLPGDIPLDSAKALILGVIRRDYTAEDYVWQVSHSTTIFAAKATVAGRHYRPLAAGPPIRLPAPYDVLGRRLGKLSAPGAGVGSSLIVIRPGQRPSVAGLAPHDFDFRRHSGKSPK
jgi:hypothetical protein